MAQPPEHARWMFVHARAIFCAAMVVNLGMEWFLSSSPPLLLLRLLLKLVPPWLLLAPVVFIFAQAWLMQRFFLNQRQSNAWAFAVTIVASLIIAV